VVSPPLLLLLLLLLLVFLVLHCQLGFPTTPNR
jgi:hypothetical protein